MKLMLAPVGVSRSVTALMESFPSNDSTAALPLVDTVARLHFQPPFGLKASATGPQFSAKTRLALRLRQSNVSPAAVISTVQTSAGPNATNQSQLLLNRPYK